MKKVNNGGEKKIMSEIVVTKDVASQTPECRPIGKPATFATFDKVEVITKTLFQT